MLTNSKEAFGAISRALHWSVFTLFVMATLGGLRASELSIGVEKLDLVFMHKSVGVCILILMLFCIFWKVSNPTPDALSTSVKSVLISRAMQFLLMALLIIQPIVGIVMSQAAGLSVSFFGFFNLPTFTAEDDSLAGKMRLFHGRLWIAITALTLAHAAGSIKQHFVLKNKTLLRMLKG